MERSGKKATIGPVSSTPARRCSSAASICVICVVSCSYRIVQGQQKKKEEQRRKKKGRKEEETGRKKAERKKTKRVKRKKEEKGRRKRKRRKPKQTVSTWATTEPARQEYSSLSLTLTTGVTAKGAASDACASALCRGKTQAASAVAPCCTTSALKDDRREIERVACELELFHQHYAGGARELLLFHVRVYTFVSALFSFAGSIVEALGARHSCEPCVVPVLAHPSCHVAWRESVHYCRRLDQPPERQTDKQSARKRGGEGGGQRRSTEKCRRENE